MTPRRGFLFCSLLLVCSAAAEAETQTGYHIVYELGLYRGLPDAVMRRQEQWARQGHMPWRRDPLLTASVLAGELLPGSSAGGFSESRLSGRRALVAGDTAWILLGEHQGRAAVQLRRNGRTAGELRLIQPFGYWWYVASARCTAVARSKAVMVHPDGCREYLPGPLVLRRRRAYLPVGQLERLGVKSEWNHDAGAAKVYLPDSDAIAWYRPCTRRVTIAATAGLRRKAIPWHPFIYRGRLYVAVTDIAVSFPRFVPMWDPASGELRLHVKPLGFAGERY